MQRRIFLLLTTCSAAALGFFATATVMKPPDMHRSMELSSSAFNNGQPIPGEYTCDGKNISPPLAWNGAPPGTESLALIVDDPDAPAGVWTHWVMFNISADSSGLPENASKSGSVLGNARQGVNDFKQIGWGGPCPPGGKQHRYFFKIYALDTVLNLPAGATKKDVEAAIAPHILAAGQLMGTYQRK